MPGFDNIISALPEALKYRIERVLVESQEVNNEMVLRAFVTGKTNTEATSLLERNLDLNELEASALAGVLVTRTSGNINDLLTAK